MNDGRLLLVEDDDDLRRLLALVCDLNGLSVRLASDVDSALEAIDMDRIDLILTDLNVGGDHDGLRVLTAGVERGLPVVVLSASVSFSDKVLYQMGAKRVVSKPFDVLSLPELIDEVRNG